MGFFKNLKNVGKIAKEVIRIFGFLTKNDGDIKKLQEQIKLLTILERRQNDFEVEIKGDIDDMFENVLKANRENREGQDKRIDELTKELKELDKYHWKLNDYVNDTHGAG